MFRMFIITLVFVVAVAAETFPSVTNIVATDGDGTTYDIDALLNEGKHIVLFNMYST